MFDWIQNDNKMKNTKKSKKGVVMVEAALAEAVKPVAVKAAAAPPPRVVLELVNPAAKQVFVAGSFNNWQPEQAPLAPAGNGRWAGHLKVGPGRHEYLFVVDGQWLPDPNAKESVENPFGGRNSVLMVAE
ncbi:MAG: glycogen-binding domain-containing protein [Limisphaerales bacterium]